ncbi:ABC transporter substrate-binding protein [Eubacteriales bacterium OttesenSCG-928-N13]|nr:ABC transporter substrate-binding protein [Eubacteriales bacterium OttesenSCG-928-N13]
MKRILSILIVLTLLLGACSTALSQEENITLTVWTGPNWTGVYSDDDGTGSYTDFLSHVGQEFTKVHPNVNVEVSLIDNAQRTEKLAVAISSGTTPNVYFESDFLCNDYIHEGLLLPLNDLVEDADRADIDQSIWDLVTYNDDVYIYPFFAENGHLMVNLSLFEKAGALDMIPERDEHGIIHWTPEQFRACLEAVSTLEDVYPFGAFAGSSPGDTWTVMMIRMFGAEYISANGLTVGMNSPEGVQGLKYFGKLQEDGLLAPGVETLTLSDLFQMFFNNQLAVCYMNDLNYFNIDKGFAEGTMEQFDYAWAYFPHENGDPKCFTYVKGGMVFAGHGDYQDQMAKEFVKFLCAGEYTKASLNMLPIRQSVIGQMEDENLISVANSLEHSVPFYNKAAGYLSIRPEYLAMMQAYFSGQKDAETALADFAASAEQILAENAELSVIFSP